MAYTHEFKLQIGENTFKGDCEYSNAGLVSFKETSNNLMSQKVLDAVRLILDTLGPLPDSYTDFTLFKVSPKE